MERLRLIMSDIVLGEPLPWDVYADTGELLLRKGHIVSHLHQLETLFQRSLFIDGEHAPNIARNKNEEKAKKPEVKQETPSVLRLVNMANKRLERLLYGITTEPDAPAKITEIARVLFHAVSIDDEIAFACIVLNQEACNYAVRHGVDTAILACMVAKAMQKPQEEIETLMAAALTMNIGMLRQHDHLQLKHDPLNDKERELIHRHPEESAALLRQVGITNQEWLAYVLMHHENEQGTGYPQGKVASLPQNVKILSFADQYCAAISERKYRKTLTPPGALRDVFAAGGKPSDPLLAAYFIKLLGAYPVGTFVRLQNNEIAVVTGKGTSHTTPVVQAMIGTSGAPLSLPLKRDTSKPGMSIRETLPSGEATLRFSMQQLWGEHAAL
jgi:HD-GYP domain-containing protein (c-di-GMP phosphodiesterase class II)